MNFRAKQFVGDLVTVALVLIGVTLALPYVSTLLESEPDVPAPGDRTVAIAPQVATLNAATALAPTVSSLPARVSPKGDASPVFTMTDFYAAIAAVETGGEADPDNGEPGDAGEIGRYQITPAYLFDANEFAGGRSDYTLAEMRNPSHARVTMYRYFQRYAPQALDSGDYETLARIHNGGPKGDAKRSTKAYAADVLDVMRKAKDE